MQYAYSIKIICPNQEDFIITESVYGDVYENFVSSVKQ